MTELQQWFNNEWWPIVPRKGSKKDAFKAVTKLDPDEDLRKKIVLAQQAQNIYNKQARTDKKFIKLPATWINKGCWDDEIGSHADLKRGKIETSALCECGNPAKVQLAGRYFCSRCYVETNSTYTPGLGNGQHKTLMYNHLKTFGMAKKKDETVPEWIKRHQDYCRENMWRVMR